MSVALRGVEELRVVQLQRGDPHPVISNMKMPITKIVAYVGDKGGIKKSCNSR